MKALLVEDDATARKFIGRKLQKLGILTTLDLATDGYQALELVHEALRAGVPYELILHDIDLPGITGIESISIIRHLEERHASIRSKIFVLTCHDKYLLRIQAKEAGCDAYLLKPLKEGVLLSELKRFRFVGSTGEET